MELPKGNENLPTLEEWKKTEFLERMRLFRGHKTKVAKSLGVTNRTLYTWLKEWGWYDDYVKRRVVHPPKFEGSDWVDI